MFLVSGEADKNVVSGGNINVSDSRINIFFLNKSFLLFML
jgi:hypothetical protein